VQCGRENGHDQVYRPESGFMAAGYTANGDTFVAEKPRVWISNVARPNWDLAPDGQAGGGGDVRGIRGSAQAGTRGGVPDKFLRLSTTESAGEEIRRYRYRLAADARRFGTMKLKPGR
jgi:hypothetical protein